MNYSLVTPVFNEAENILDLINSIVSQTKLPEKWIIVDDGCTDNTIDIIEKHSKENPFIKVVTHKINSHHSSGSKISKAFLFGYNTLKNESFDLIGKIDADLIFPTNYFETICSNFQNNENLGLYGGICVLDQKEEVVSNSDHVRGALKLYRRTAL